MFDISGLILPVISVIIVAMLMGIAYLILNLRRVVPTNMVHIVQVGKISISYGAGSKSGNSYYEWPVWIPIFGLSVIKLPLSVFGVELSKYEAYDSARVPFMVDIKAFFRIADPAAAAQYVQSFQQVNTDLKDVLQGVVRRILGRNKLEEIMEARSSLSEEFTKEVSDQLKSWGIETAKVIEFMNIQDANGSEVIANIMAKEQSRIDKESRTAVAENNRAAEEKEIEAQRQIDLSKQEAQQTVGIRTAQKEQEVGIAKEKSNQTIQEQARITAERLMAVTQVEEVKKAEITKEVSIIKAEEKQKVDTVTATAAKTVQVTKAEADSEAARIAAEGRLDATKKDAEGIAATGTATAEAQRALLMAPVSTQIELAKEIGANDSYQTYLISIEQIRVNGEVGKEMAGAIGKADLKIIANSGDIQGGMGKLTDMFSPKGGTALTGMLSALANTPEGSALVNRITGGKSE